MKIAMTEIPIWATEERPLIVGIGGTTRSGSSCEKALCCALRAVEAQGARTLTFGAEHLKTLPHYAPEKPDRSPEARRMIEAIARCDGVIISSPGYHGSISGLLKNAIDYVEDLRTDPRPYLEGRAVGLIVSAAGWQATATTLVALRSVAHALRGWPTPLGVCINTAEPVFDNAGRCLSGALTDQMEILASQLMRFSRALSARPVA